MTEISRAPKLIKKDGYCFIQNGTNEKVSKDAAWAIMAPSLDIMDSESKTYMFAEMGVRDIEGGVSDLVNELQALIMQIGQLVVKIKRENGSFLILDPDYFINIQQKIENGLAEMPYKLAKQIEIERAREFAEQYRICIRHCVLHNYEQTIALKIKEKYADKITLSQDKYTLIENIALRARQDNVKIDF